MNKYQQPELTQPPGSDVEVGSGTRPESNFRGLSDVQKWKKEDWMKKGVLALILRSCALVFSFLAFILFATLPGFHLTESMSYGFAIALIAMVYTVVQVGIKGHELRTGNDVITPELAYWIDFIGDQVLAYMLFSSASVGAAITNPARKLAYRDPTLDHIAAAISMSFLAFFSLASAALISSYHLFAELSKS
ncbi:CASP-like protein 4B1 [Amaranthus tricolor]|uniref:CASP-like protein 4B1 n=1 Tax=Amaranthus tricolor TaxID=29722 RepID=UPI002590FE68|nr:CASP-like protein 4B1 [Amaranthus tricolor]